jgi:hypothetical protein
MVFRKEGVHLNAKVGSLDAGVDVRGELGEEIAARAGKAVVAAGELKREVYVFVFWSGSPRLIP